MCASKRSEADGLGAGNLGEEVLEAVHDAKGALDRLGRLEGVNLGKAREPGDFLVPLGVVLHGAAAEGVETAVYAEVQLAQAGEVADQVKLTELRDIELGAKEILPRGGGRGARRGRGGSCPVRRGRGGL